MLRHLRRAAGSLRPFSSEPSPTAASSPGKVNGGDNLGRRLLNLTYAKRSTVVVLQRWIEEGRRIQKYQLKDAVRHLRARNRYKHALEICEWITIQKDFRLLPGDYAIHLDLVAKVRGLRSAEKFFEDLPEQMKKQSTWTALLHAYVLNNESSKAESLMETMTARGFLTCPLPYNHMVNLYITNGQLEKVSEVIQEMKRHIVPDVITYNLWLTAIASTNDVKAAGKVLIDMHQRRISPDWITYSTLAKIFIQEKLFQKAKKVLGEMEKVVSKKERKAFCSLITLHANLSGKEDVIRIWTEMKSLFPKLSDLEYFTMLTSLVKIGDTEEAEKIYGEWESISRTRDTKITNTLLSAYTKSGMMEKARSFLEIAEKRGTKPNYATWEYLVRGYLEQNKIDDALTCLKQAFASLKKWQPNEGIVKAVFDKIETSGDYERGEQFLVMLRKAGYVTTQIYNSLLRTYAKASKMPLIVVERMTEDKVHPDDETTQLITITSRLCATAASTLFS